MTCQLGSSFLYSFALLFLHSFYYLCLFPLRDTMESLRISSPLKNLYINTDKDTAVRSYFRENESIWSVRRTIFLPWYDACPTGGCFLEAGRWRDGPDDRCSTKFRSSKYPYLPAYFSTVPKVRVVSLFLFFSFVFCLFLIWSLTSLPKPISTRTSYLRPL